MQIGHLTALYREHARNYYRRPDGTPTTEAGTIGQALAVVDRCAAGLGADAFGPAALKTVRGAMVELGWCRTHINKQVSRVRGMFRWAVEEEMVGPAVYERLRCVRSLAPHRSPAPERPAVAPVADAHVLAVRPHVAPQVWALIRLQQLTAARAGELVTMRLLDLDMGRDDVWVYRPLRHKTQWADRRRTVWLGPSAIEVVRPYIARPVDAALFSPRQAYAARLNRSAPPSVGDHYTTASYRRCISRACEAAGVAGWSPHQLRHAAATRLRREHGIEVARLILGHAATTTTEIYAERDAELAAAVMGRIG